ncbi:M15 family metallopeptidase [Demequina soli]|uniref:M15 family metallopeptidase n=1 Tax=Demequina soli TaxID=1638987 RepID=UPI0007818138|nr:M15 family metallopeptidase [Demequina soli]
MTAGEAARPRVPAVTVAVACFALGIIAGAFTDQWNASRAIPVATESPAPSATPVASASPTPAASASPVAGVASAAPDATAAAAVTPPLDLTAHSVDDPGSVWVVVNKVRPLDPQDYAPDDLQAVADVPGGATMRADAAAAMTALHAEAVDAGAGFTITTGYRDHDLQASLYDGYVADRGREAADMFSARPGYSEHQTGLAADIQADGCRLEACFADTAAGRFVAAHAWEHGFIVRYPDDERDVTGYIYEPWHLRFVGVELATWMHRAGETTLERVFGLDPAPDYR